MNCKIKAIILEYRELIEEKVWHYYALNGFIDLFGKNISKHEHFDHV